MTPRTAAATLLLSVFTTIAAAQPSKRLVVIDQDANAPGNSSMESMLLLLDDPSVQVLGITIESGDGWQRESVSRTLRMLELTHHTDVPVYIGATFPLVNTQALTRRWETLYGPWPYKGAWSESFPTGSANTETTHAPDIVPTPPEGQPILKPAAEPAAVFLAHIVHEHPHQISFLALGPVTNLALAARLDDNFAALAKDLIFMAGSFSPQPSTPDEFSDQLLDTPRMAFNIRWDPEAAQIVLHAPWPHITLVTEDATLNVRLPSALFAQLAASPTPSAQYLAHFGSNRFPMWDTVASALYLDPSLATRTRQVAVDVDLDRGANYGATLSWAPAKQPHLGEPVVDAVLAVDATRIQQLYLHHLTHTP
jgi:inosine-uridine nucleoside N-ribohydrolase